MWGGRLAATRRTHTAHRHRVRPTPQGPRPTDGDSFGASSGPTAPASPPPGPAAEAATIPVCSTGESGFPPGWCFPLREDLAALAVADPWKGAEGLSAVFFRAAAQAPDRGSLFSFAALALSPWRSSKGLQKDMALTKHQRCTAQGA